MNFFKPAFRLLIALSLGLSLFAQFAEAYGWKFYLLLAVVSFICYLITQAGRPAAPRSTGSVERTPHNATPVRDADN